MLAKVAEHRGWPIVRTYEDQGISGAKGRVQRELRAVGCDKIFDEQVSSVTQREQLELALDYVREGDTFIVTKLDRLARSVGDLLEIVARLEAKKVCGCWRCQARSRSAIGRLMLAVIGAVGQAEREAMLERQREGIAKAKAQGRLQRSCADCSAAGGRDHPAQGGRRQPLGNRWQAGDRPGPHRARKR